MALDTVERKAATYFFGTEVEHTPMKDEITLFVVGVRPVDEIAKHINNYNKSSLVKCRHVYLGTSQSFHPSSNEEWDAWDKMITELLDAGYWVTLDFGVEYAGEIHEEGWCESNTFIPMISVKLPYIKLYNYNATLKIDDTTWGHSNPGVWCHPLNELLKREVYTDWKDYVGDEPVE